MKYTPIKIHNPKNIVFSRDNIENKINLLNDRIEETPKSKKWKMRATVGTKRKWYKDVEEVERGDWLEESPNS